MGAKCKSKLSGEAVGWREGPEGEQPHLHGLGLSTAPKSPRPSLLASRPSHDLCFAQSHPTLILLNGLCLLGGFPRGWTPGCSRLSHLEKAGPRNTPMLLLSPSSARYILAGPRDGTGEAWFAARATSYCPQSRGCTRGTGGLRHLRESGRWREASRAGSWDQPTAIAPAAGDPSFVLSSAMGTDDFQVVGTDDFTCFLSPCLSFPTCNIRIPGGEQSDPLAGTRVPPSQGQTMARGTGPRSKAAGTSKPASGRD